MVARHVPSIAAEAAALYAAFRAPSPAVAAIALGPVVLGEELVWRGAVQAALVGRFGRRGGVFLAAVAYALAHAALGSPLLVVVAFLCGIAWGALRAASKSLIPPLVAHLVWDVLVLALAAARPRMKPPTAYAPSTLRSQRPARSGGQK